MPARLKTFALAAILGAAVAIPVTASPTGDATWTLASYKAMAEPQVPPSERIMAVYLASAERFEMLNRLKDRYPALVR